MQFIIPLLLVSTPSLLAIRGSDEGVDQIDMFREKRQALPEYRRWTNQTLNYYFDEELPLEMQAMFRDAFKYLRSHTCIKFQETRDTTFTVRIREDKIKHLCNARFGMQQYVQSLRFSFDCGNWGVAVHELMHTLGIAHAQARSDRDDYLIVNSNDYNDELNPNTYNPVPFDYGSLMLYERKEGRIPRDPEYNYTMGNLRVAFYDMMLLNIFYKCNCDSHPKLECQHGGYQNPAKCDECLCTDGFTGKLCDAMEGHVVEASTEWKASGFVRKRRSGSLPDTTPVLFYFHVTAPPGATIEVRLTQLSGFFCQNTCDFNGVEIKYKEDRRITSPLVCCDNDNLWNKTRSTTNSPLVIVKYGDDRGPRLEFEYRYVPGNGTAKTADLLNNTIGQ
ncbi:unnamed protein product [Caenorhabditis sp. 36 PRJEB53466]|nr:unnamed protein product [Caenorhabditis sp. 36 PRJEB53466]